MLELDELELFAHRLAHGREIQPGEVDPLDPDGDAVLIDAVTDLAMATAIFDRAIKTQPCVMFIDEVDAIGGSRDSAHHCRRRAPRGPSSVVGGAVHAGTSSATLLQSCSPAGGPGSRSMTSRSGFRGVPSGLLVSFTSYVTTDVAAAPDDEDVPDHAGPRAFSRSRASS